MKAKRSKKAIAVSVNGNGSYKISHDIPLPPEKAAPLCVKSFRAMLKMMVPGDSVLIKDKSPKLVGVQAHNAFGKGNYAIHKTKRGARLWRRA